MVYHWYTTEDNVENRRIRRSFPFFFVWRNLHYRGQITNHINLIGFVDMNKNQFFPPSQAPFGGHQQFAMQPPSLGPTSPSIFVGHFGTAESSDKSSVCVQGREFSLSQPAKLEGIHVIPFGITPPGLSIEGKTKPTMAVRPFNLHMFGRNVLDKQMVPIFALTVHGGVQWMPVNAPFDSLTVDMIAFDGDFETLSVIVSGFPVAAAVEDVNESEDEGDEEVSVSSDSDKTDKADNPLYKLQSAALLKNSTSHSKLNAKLRKITLSSGDRTEQVMRIESRLRTTWLANSQVSIKSVAALVGEIFSFAENVSQYDSSAATGKSPSDVRSKIDLLNSLTQYLSVSLELNSTEGSETDNNSNDNGSNTDNEKDSVSSVIGPEAANLFCSIAVNGFDDLLHFDSFLVTNSSSSTDDAETSQTENGTGTASDDSTTKAERGELYEAYGMALFTGCKAILANTFMASEFLDCGGIAVLTGLLQQHQRRQEPCLPAHMFLHLLDSIRDAVRHYDLACRFNEPAEDSEHVDSEGRAYLEQETSPYQALLHVADGLKEDDQAADSVGQTLRWCALVESLNALSLLSYTVFNDVARVSEAVAASHASVNNNTMSGSGGDGDDEGRTSGDTRTVLHASCGIVEALYGTATTRVESVLIALGAVMTDLRKDCQNGHHSVLNSAHMAPLLNTLSKGKVMLSLLAVSSLAQIAQDLSTSVDWAAPQSAQLRDHTTALRQLLVTFLSQLVQVPMIGSLLTMHSEEVQVVFTFLSSHTTVVSCLPLTELLAVNGASETSVSDLSLHLQSYGWAMWLMGHVYSSITAEFLALKPVLEGGGAAAESGGRDLSESELESLNKLVTELVDLCTGHHVCREVVARVVASSFLSEMLLLVTKTTVAFTAAAMTTIFPTTAEKALSGLLHLVQVCCVSADSAVVAQVKVLSSQLEDCLAAARDAVVSAVDNESGDRVVKLFDDLDSILLSAAAMELGDDGDNDGEDKKTSTPCPLVDALKAFSVQSVVSDNSNTAFVQLVTTTTTTRAANSLVSSLSLDAVKALCVAGTEILTKCHKYVTALQARQAVLVASGGGDEEEETAAESEAAVNGTGTDAAAAEGNDDDDISASKPSLAECMSYFLNILSALLVTLATVNDAIASSGRSVDLTNSKHAELLSVFDSYLIAVVDMHFLLDSVLSDTTSTELSTGYRLVGTRLVAALQLFCPPHADRAAVCGLVPYLLKRAFSDRLKHFTAVCALLDSIVPDRFSNLSITSGGENDSEDGPEALTRMIHSRRFENQDIATVEEKTATSAEENEDEAVATSARDLGVACQRDDQVDADLRSKWADFLSRSLVKVKSKGSKKKLTAAEKALHVLGVKYSRKAGDEDNGGGGGKKKSSRKRKAEEEAAAANAADVATGGATAATATVVVRATSADHNTGEDMLYRCMASRDYSLVALVLAGMMASSRAGQVHTLSLLHKCCAADKSLAMLLCGAVANTVKHNADVHLAPPAAVADDDADKSNQVMLVNRLLVFVDAACHENLACFLLVQKGILSPLVALLQSDKDSTVLLAVEALTTVYRTLSRVSVESVTMEPSLAAVEGDSSEQSLQHSTSFVLETIGSLIVAQLPKTYLRFEDAPHLLLLLQQGPATLQLLSLEHNRQFMMHLSQVGAGITVEFLAVKLWIAFEESFKLLTSAAETVTAAAPAAPRVDPRKARQEAKNRVSVDGTEDGKDDAATAAATAEREERERQNIEGLVQFERAVWALQAVVELAFTAYTQGMIPLATLARAMRTSQTDPKKVARRIQRAYTMWATGLATTHDEDGNYQRNIHSVIASRQRLLSMADSEAFESRHAVICHGLKALVDNMNVLSTFMLAKEKTYSGAPPEGSLRRLSAEEEAAITALDLAAPYALLACRYPDIETTLFDNLFGSHVYNQRVGRRSEASSLNALNCDFSRDLVRFSDPSANRKECFPVRYEPKVSSSESGLFEVKRRIALVGRNEKASRKKGRFGDMIGGGGLYSVPLAGLGMPIPSAMGGGALPAVNGFHAPPQGLYPPSVGLSIGGGGGAGGAGPYSHAPGGPNGTMPTRPHMPGPNGQLQAPPSAAGQFRPPAFGQPGPPTFQPPAAGGARFDSSTGTFVPQSGAPGGPVSGQLPTRPPPFSVPPPHHQMPPRGFPSGPPPSFPQHSQQSQQVQMHPPRGPVGGQPMPRGPPQGPPYNPHGQQQQQQPSHYGHRF